jgi:DNA polymerase III subunit gamma/tau
MSFIVTARKWRPLQFSEVVGQEHITATLKNAIKNNRIAHAYLFTGPRGVGKTTTARIFAKVLNCLDPVDTEPCNKCEMCLSIQNSQSFDFIEIDGASNRGIDEIRTLRESVKYAPTKGKYKVYIIDEVHMLTKESFNAFLKTLEEPPAHIIFIFATTDVHKVPLTIISRCQRYDFRRIQMDTIKTLLNKIAKSEKIEIDDKALTIIAKKADGALRDAESYFDQVVSFCGNKIDAPTVSKMLNLIDEDVYFELSGAVLTKDFKKVFDISRQIYENGWNFIDFMDGLVEHFRNIMTVIATGKTDFIETAEVYRMRYLDYIDKFSEGDMLRLLNFLNKTQQELRFSQNQKLKIEIALTHMVGLERSATISSVISGIETGTNASASAKKDIPTKHTPEKKSEVKPVTAVPQSSSASLRNKIIESAAGFEQIVDTWQSFVDSVSDEKGLILGPFIKTTKVVSVDGNQINIASSHSDSAGLLKINKDYFSQKIFQIFGKKMKINLLSVEVSTKDSATPDSSKTEDDDPYVSAIKKELGGKLIR